MFGHPYFYGQISFYGQKVNAHLCNTIILTVDEFKQQKHVQIYLLQKNKEGRKKKEKGKRVKEEGRKKKEGGRRKRKGGR